MTTEPLNQINKNAFNQTHAIIESLADTVTIPGTFGTVSSTIRPEHINVVVKKGPEKEIRIQAQKNYLYIKYRY